MCIVNQLVDDFLTFLLIDQIEGVSVERNVIDRDVVGHFLVGSDVVCIVVYVCFCKEV